MGSSFREELVAFCEKNGDRIFVRDVLGGKVGNYAWSMLPEYQQQHHLDVWEHRGKYPVMVAEDYHDDRTGD